MKYLIRKPDTFMNTLNEEINSILRRSFDSVFPEYVLEKETKGLTIPVDIKEFDTEYKIRVEVPGKKNKKYHKTEFAYGNYSRTIYFPQEIDIAQSSAKLDNGVLCLTLPKAKTKEDETQKIEIKD